MNMVNSNCIFPLLNNIFAFLLQNKLKKQESSGNRDNAEGVFDALMQVAACEKVRQPQ